MLIDYTPTNQKERILLAIYEQLVEINNKLNKEQEEEIVVETKQRKRRGDNNV